MMKAKNGIILAALIVFGLLSLFPINAFAQAEEPVRIINLSRSGYDQANSVSFSANGKYLAVAGTSGVYLFDAWQLSELNYISSGVWARSVSFFPGTSTLAAGLHDGTIKFWTNPDGKLEKTLEGNLGWVRSISFSGDGSLLASASDDDSLRIWNTKDFSAKQVIRVFTTGIRAVALSQDGSLVAGALGDNTVRVWTVSDGKLRYTLRGHDDWVRCLAFSPDGLTLASGSFDRKILLWNLLDGSLVRTLKGHTSSVLSLIYSPDGQTLASGSVDQTVHLWRVADGQTFRVLQGHKGFVYSVAFSPDGKTLASGGADNAVRLWDMNVFGKPSPDALTTSPETTSDCRSCHHRRGLAEPPRIIALNCEGCHSGGIGLSWCAGFARSVSAISGPVHVTPVKDPSGVPVNNRDIAVVIASPGNGETLYVRGKSMVPEYITGKVYISDPKIITKVEIQLDIIYKGEISSTLLTKPAENGEFVFNVAINPESPPPHLSRPGTRQCLVCHGDYMPDGGIPAGDIRLVVTAIALDGQKASDERWLHVDSSHEASLPVQVVDEKTGQPLSGISVEAFTLLYQWRDRFGSTNTKNDGIGSMNLDALSIKPTTYTLSIPPQVRNGLLYASQEPAKITLDPTSATHPAVILNAKALSGHIIGNLLMSAALPDTLLNTSIRAIQLPAGPVYQVPVGDRGKFVFNNIPVSQYLLVPDTQALARQNLYAAMSQVDLFTAPISNLTIALDVGRPLTGQISTKDGKFLPFAWVRSGDGDMVWSTNPVSGDFLLPDLAGQNYVTVTAPGYYALPQSVKVGQKNLDFDLTPRPEIQQYSWGNGFITVPPEAVVTVNGLDFELESGWLWGEADSPPQPVLIHIPGLDIQVTEGKFALETPVKGDGWLYVFKGKAVLVYAGKPGVEVQSGQMIALFEGVAPLSLDPVVISALHPAEKNPVLIEIIEPTFAARIRSWLVKTGIGAMQMITFITYILSLVTLIAIPLFGLFWYRKVRRIKLVEQEKK